MSALREIFVKAVCARGRETFQRTHRFRAKYHPEEVLGARVTNPQCRAVLQDGRVRVVGSYDVHVWYSYAAGSHEDGSQGPTHTAVAVQTFEFSVPVPVECLTDDLSSVQNPEVRVQAVRSPHVKDCAVDADGVIHVTVEDGYSVQVVGETSLWVPAYAGLGAQGDHMKKSDDHLWEALQDAEESFDDEWEPDEEDVDLDEEALGALDGEGYRTYGAR